MFQFHYQFGSTLIECSPFAQVVSTSQKGDFCDYCLNKIEDEIKCPDCGNSYYCSSICYKNDLIQHQIECRANLFEKTQKRLSNLVMTLESSSQEDVASLIHYFNLDDLIDYTLLFFRVLKQNIPDSSTFNCKFGDRNYQIDWKALQTSTKVQSSLKRPRKDDTDLFYYVNNFDSLSKSELEELDRYLGVELPNENQFREFYLENHIKQTLSDIIESVVDEIDNERYGSNSSFKNENDSIEIKEKNRDEEWNKEELLNICMESQKNLLNNLDFGNMSLDEFSKYISKNMFDILKNSFKSSKSQDLPKSQMSFDKKIKEEYDESFDWFQNSFPNENNYSSIYLHYDPSIVDKEEAEAINLMKRNCRLIYLDIFNGNRSSTHETELGCYFETWIAEILKLLNDVNLLQYFGTNDYNIIEKSFFIAIRYSIAISDELSILTKGRAVYLPLTQMKHSCLPNTSLVFEGNYLKVYYFPKNKLRQSLQTKKINLNLNDLNVDFNHENNTKESINVYKLNKFRFLNCKCVRCQQTKKQVHEEINQLYDQFTEDNCDEEPSFLPDSELINEYKIISNQYQTNSEQNKSNLDDIDHTKKIIDYDYYFKRLREANFLYGNRPDPEYSIGIHNLLVEIIDSYRFVFGHYHKQTTILLMFINFANLIIIKHQKDNVEKFYRCLYLHSYMLDLFDSLCITHGLEHCWTIKLNQIHGMFHNFLLNLFNNNEKEIQSLLKRIGKLSFSAEQFNLDKCHLLQSFSSGDLNKVKDIHSADHRSKMNNHYEDYLYNPYLSDMSTFDEQMDQDVDVNQEQLDEILKLLNEISDYYSFRFL